MLVHPIQLTSTLTQLNILSSQYQQYYIQTLYVAKNHQQN